MPSPSTTLSAPNTSYSFDYYIASDILHISGKSCRRNTYTLSTSIDKIYNITSVTLKIKYNSSYIILFPGEEFKFEDEELSGGTTLTIYPCVKMNLVLDEAT